MIKNLSKNIKHSNNKYSASLAIRFFLDKYKLDGIFASNSTES